METARNRRELLEAEKYTPELLHGFLADLEETTHSSQVWTLLVTLGKTLDLPFVDLMTAGEQADWQDSLSVQTSYDADWLYGVDSKPDLQKWSYFRAHAMRRLTPIAVGIEFIDEFIYLPTRQVDVLRLAAEQGIRSGFAIPMRISTPPQAAMVTFSGDHSRTRMLAIIKAHGWTLNAAAMASCQKYTAHFAAELPERTQISPKQRELLELIGIGLQDKQIADRLNVSVSAVRQRMRTLMDKTGQAKRTELAALAMSMGILPDPLKLGKARSRMSESGRKQT